MSVISFVLHGFYAVGFSSDLIIAQIKKPCFFYNSFLHLFSRAIQRSGHYIPFSFHGNEEETLPAFLFCL